MPLLETKGAASAQGFGLTLGPSYTPTYIEEVFSTWLYTGNGSTQTITNGIDLSTKGGLVWIKSRSTATDNALFDTARGASNGFLSSNTTGTPYASPSSDLTSFGASGFSITNSTGNVNVASRTYSSWTFREQAKFFDVVTYTGNGSVRTIAHNLGSVPGCIIVKKTSGADNWFVQHRSLGSTQYIALNDADSAYTNSQLWNNTDPTSSVFTLGTNSGVNQSGATYVAYLFAHNAGGFGLTGTDNVISCGSYTGSDSSEVVVNLGYEPQWLLIKRATNANDPYRGWTIFDNMRRMAVTGTTASLIPNSSDAENSTYANSRFLYPTATGFNLLPGFNRTCTAGETFIYIAIRRGPMKTPTTGTSVYSALAYSGDQSNNRILSQGTAGPADLFWFMNRNVGANTFSATGLYSPIYDRLRGIIVNNSSVGQLCPALGTPFTNAEGNVYSFTLADTQTDFSVSGAQGDLNGTNSTVLQMFRRAPGFFDEVCYTGTGTNTTQAHNLGVAPELIICKNRSVTTFWAVYSASLGNTQGIELNATNAASTQTAYWNSTSPTSSVFTVGTDNRVNGSGNNMVAYLFASCPGVSKVGSYTGTGALQTVNCGFTGGARFVLIKRTDSTGDWFVYDSARGITSGNDPYLLTNGTAAEVTGTNYVDTTSVGFQVTAAAPAGLNANGGTYLFLAIA